MTEPDLERVLHEMRRGLVASQRYSRKSLVSRCSGLVMVTLLACIAVFGGILLAETGRPRPPE